MFRNRGLLMGLTAAVLLTSACKSGFIAAKGEDGRGLSSEEVYERITVGKTEAEGYRGKIRASLTQPNSKKEVSLSVRYAKDQGLLFSAPLGVAKALITPEKLAYYNKLNRTYFEGSFKDLDSLLPISFSFDQLQRLLNADVVFADQVSAMKEVRRLRRTKSQMHYSASFNSTDFGNATYEVVVQLNPTRIVHQELVSTKLKTPVIITYIYENEGLMPGEIKLSGAGKTLHLFLSDFEPQKAVSLPFQIPSGYRRAVKQ